MYFFEYFHLREQEACYRELDFLIPQTTPFSNFCRYAQFCWHARFLKMSNKTTSEILNVLKHVENYPNKSEIYVLIEKLVMRIVPACVAGCKKSLQ